MIILQNLHFLAPKTVVVRETILRSKLHFIIIKI